jgi:uncharacterized membrane protein
MLDWFGRHEHHHHHSPPQPQPLPSPAQLESEVWLLREILWTLREILSYVKPRTITHEIAIQFSNSTGDSIMADNALVFNVGQTSTATIQPLAADGVTPSGGTVSNASFSFNDPSATVTLNSDGVTATCTAVAASTNGAVVGTASCTVTDSDGAVSTWNQQFTVLVNGVVPPQQLTQSIAVQFSTPTP